MRELNTVREVDILSENICLSSFQVESDDSAERILFEISEDFQI